MYKNKIKNKLQKLSTRPDIPSLLPDTPQPPCSLPQPAKSTRRSKLSLSKDLSVRSQNSSENSHPLKAGNSVSVSKKAYMRVVSSSGRKDLLALSNSKICLTAHGDNSERTQDWNYENREESMFQDGDKGGRDESKGSADAMGLKDMAVSLARSAAILNDRIVPVLLQAATLSHKVPQKASEDQMVPIFLGSTTDLYKKQEQETLTQTPINHLKHRASQEKQAPIIRKNTGMRCETEPNNGGSLQKYRNRHKIQHSPAPVKNKSLRGSFCTPTDVKRHSQAHQNQQEGTKAEIDVCGKIDCTLNPLGKKLELINCQRKKVECRIAKKLDELSSKATSIVKQYGMNQTELAESHSKIPKVLLNSNKSKIGVKACTSRKENWNAGYQGQQSNPHLASSSKEQQLRSMIMNRIFS